MRTHRTDRLTDPAQLTYRQAVAALTERGRFGISMGLERVERLMEAAGNPERGLRGALVGGTNGKGSVVAMTRSVLVAAGHRVGTMPKPHLASYRERVEVDGEPISGEAFAAAVATVLPAIDRVGADVGPSGSTAFFASWRRSSRASSSRASTILARMSRSSWPASGPASAVEGRRQRRRRPRRCAAPTATRSWWPARSTSWGRFGA